MNVLRSLLVSIAALLCIAGVAAAQAEAPADPPSIADMESQLIQLAIKGKLTPEMEELFFKYADARAREKLLPTSVSEEFWTWLSGNKLLHRAMLINLHPDYSGGAVMSLAALRDARPADVAKYPHLAAAFALVHGNAGKQPVRGGWVRRTRDLSTVPPMLESFGYYIDNARRMVYPLDKLPWTLLVYVADNDIPLAERDWVFNQYGPSGAAAFPKLYMQVPYDYDGLAAAADQSKLKITNHPYTLPNILQIGGVCADRAYFSSRIMKTLGVPAMYDAGQGARGGHAWLVWITVNRGVFGMTDSGRFDYDNYYTGEIWNPVIRKRILDRDAELVAAAMNVSYDSYIGTLAVTHIFSLCTEEKAKAANLLIEAIKRNHYCAELWHLLGAVVADGTLPAKQGEQLFGQMVKPFGTYPDLTFRFLQDIIKPRLTPTEKVADRDVTANLAMLEKAFNFYQQAQRPDLAVNLRLLQGQYLEAVGQQDRAVKLYVAASQQYAKEHFGFIPLFDKAVEMMTDDSQQPLRLRYLTFMAGAVPEFSGSANTRTRSANSAFAHVVKKYVEELDACGKGEEARKWESRLPKKGG